MSEETDLLGNPVAPEAPREKKAPPINDMSLVQDVIRAATITGFVLVGRAQRVHQRVTGNEVERVTCEVDRAVHQLLDAKWLTVGGTHQVRYCRYQGPGRSVLVPKSSRDAVSRWAALKSISGGARGKGAA